MSEKYSKAYLLGIVDLLINATNYPLSTALYLTLESAGIKEKDIAQIKEAIAGHADIEKMFDNYRDNI